MEKKHEAPVEESQQAGTDSHLIEKKTAEARKNSAFAVAARSHSDIAAQMSYSTFLAKLLSAGQRLPDAMPHIIAGVNDFQAGGM